jgi:hypothetical protein
MKLKVLELKQEKPLSEVEGLMDKFIEEQGKAGIDVEVEEIAYFESTFHRTHGVVLRYDASSAIVFKLKHKESEHVYDPSLPPQEPESAGGSTDGSAAPDAGSGEAVPGGEGA